MNTRGYILQKKMLPHVEVKDSSLILIPKTQKYWHLKKLPSNLKKLQPFCVVEQEPFRDFVKELLPNLKWSRLSLHSMMDDASKEIKAVGSD